MKVLKVIVELEELKVLKVQDKGSFRRWCDSLFAPQPQPAQWRKANPAKATADSRRDGRPNGIQICQKMLKTKLTFVEISKVDFFAELVCYGRKEVEPLSK